MAFKTVLRDLLNVLFRDPSSGMVILQYVLIIYATETYITYFLEAARFPKAPVLAGRLFWAQIALAVARAISGPKKRLDFQHNPSNGPRNVFSPHQNHNGPRHIINRFINSYNYLNQKITAALL